MNYTTNGSITLDQLKPGQHARIIKVNANGQFRKRLMEMGFIENATIFVEKVAPLRDPVEYVLKGYHVSLRLSEAAHIEVKEEKKK